MIQQEQKTKYCQQHEENQTPERQKKHKKHRVQQSLQQRQPQGCHADQ